MNELTNNPCSENGGENEPSNSARDLQRGSTTRLRLPTCKCPRPIPRREQEAPPEDAAHEELQEPQQDIDDDAEQIEEHWRIPPANNACGCLTPSSPASAHNKRRRRSRRSP